MASESKSNEAYMYYLNADLSKYIGYWIAIVDQKVVAYGKNVKEVYEKAKKEYPDKRPLLAKIPKEKNSYLLIFMRLLNINRLSIPMGLYITLPRFR